MVKHFFRHLINGLRGKFIYPAFQKTRMKYKENVCWFRVQSVMEHLKEKLLGTKDQSLWPLFRSGREFENFQPWRDWNPFEINELWLPRTYLGFPFQQHFSMISFSISVQFFVFHTNSADSSYRICHLTFISTHPIFCSEAQQRSILP